MSGDEVRFHVSVDDVFASLFAADGLSEPWEAEPFFAFCDALQRDFSVPIDWYVFYRGQPAGLLVSLADLSPALGLAIASRSRIRLGPHAVSYELPPHAQTPDEQRSCFDEIYAQLERLGVSLAKPFLRLHFFSECFELADYFRDRGVEAIFLTDKDAVTYRCPDDIRAALLDSGAATYHDMGLRRSHLRVERFHDRGDSWDDVRSFIDETLDAHGFVSVFTHEVDLDRPAIRELLTRSVEYLVEQGAVAV